MNNPFQGLGEQVQCPAGDALKAELNTRVHLIGKKPRRAKPKREKKTAPVAVRRTAGAPKGRRFPPVSNPWGLTGAQCAVMAKLVEGNDTKEIADALYIAPKTVELHLHNARKAIGVNKTFMAALAWDRFHRPTTPHPAETAQPSADVQKSK